MLTAGGRAPPFGDLAKRATAAGAGWLVGQGQIGSGGHNADTAGESVQCR
jgi:hypothetical protein